MNQEEREWTKRRENGDAGIANARNSRRGKIADVGNSRREK